MNLIKKSMKLLFALVLVVSSFFVAPIQAAESKTISFEFIPKAENAEIAYRIYFWEEPAENLKKEINQPMTKDADTGNFMFQVEVPKAVERLGYIVYYEHNDIWIKDIDDNRYVNLENVITKVTLVSGQYEPEVSYSDGLPTVEVDKTALIAALAEGESKSESEYTPESFLELTQALNNGRSVNENNEATQEEVNTATTAINTAIAALVLKEPEQPSKEIILHFQPSSMEHPWQTWFWAYNIDGHEIDAHSTDDFGYVYIINNNTNLTEINFLFRSYIGTDNPWASQTGNYENVQLTDGAGEFWIKQNDPQVYDSLPTEPEELLTEAELTIHYVRFDNDYNGWNVWSWLPGKDGSSYALDENHSTTITYTDENGISSVGIIVRKSLDNNDWAEKNTDQDLFFSDFDEEGKAEIWIVQKDPKIYRSLDEIPSKIVNAVLSDPYSIRVTVSKELKDEELTDFVVEGYEIKSVLKDSDNPYQLVIEATHQILLDRDVTITHPIYGEFVLPLLQGYLHSKEFNEANYYDGILGAIYSLESTTFRLWAPSAKSVELIVYSDDKLYPMSQGEKGTWEYTYAGDASLKEYRYRITFNDGTIHEANDPYARAVTINGIRSVVVDSGSLKPAGFTTERMPKFTDETDAIIYEAHVRDLTIGPDNGIVNKGKFIGLTESGTVTAEGNLSGLDYLASLGVTHIQFLPIYDFDSVDEAGDLSFNAQYNWGYDPLHFNVPEGSYSTNPEDPTSRILELKAMIQAIHDRGMYVIMDVVYNHVYNVERSPLHQTVPGYYFRYDENGNLHNGTGVGNETASEQLMYRKYMIDSLKYWAFEYNIDGFRFDLMGIHDVETMNQIRRELNKIDDSIIILGEGWQMGNHPQGVLGANQYNADKLNGISFFNDAFRDAVKGDNFNATNPGYINGGSSEDHAWFVLNGIKSQYIRPYINPQQNVLYNEAHDNYTMYDKLLASNPGDDDLTRVFRHTHATSLQLLGNGMVFIHAGQENLRTKGGDHNSYKSPDSVNVFDYDRASTYDKAHQFFKDLIVLRKSEDLFRMKSFVEINEKLAHTELSSRHIVYKIMDDAKEYIIISSSQEQPMSIDLEPGDYQVVARDMVVYNDEADREVLSGISSVEVQPHTITILLKVPVTHTVTFDSSGGTSIEAKSVLDGELLILPEAPVREAYEVFEGWYVDEALNTKFDETQPITSDLTLYAKYDLIPTDKVALKAAIDQAEALESSMYTEDSYAAVTTALEAGKSVYENDKVTQEQVDQATDALQKAIDSLVEVEEPEEPIEVDKSLLAKLVETAEAIDKAEYTADSYQALETALATAKEVLQDEQATQEQVDEAKDALQKAIDSLVEVEEPEEPIEVDKSLLANLVETAGDIDKEEYTTDSYQALEKALAAAKDVLQDEQATQEQVDEAKDVLQKAIDDLVKVEEPVDPEKPEEPIEVDKSLLAKLVETAEAIDKSDYTSDSYQALEKALAKAKEVLEDDEATQEQINQAKERIQQAIDNLVKVSKPVETSYILEDEVTGVKVYVPVGAFESKPVLVVKPVNYPLKDHKTLSYDIYFMINGKVVLPAVEVTVDILAKDMDVSKVVVYHVGDGLETMKHVVVGSSVRFTTKDFSVYVLAEKQSDLPKTGHSMENLGKLSMLLLVGGYLVLRKRKDD